MSFLALNNISVCSEWKKSLKATNSVTEHPSWPPEGQSARKGWIWAGPFWTHWVKLPQGRIIEWLLHPMLLSFGKRTLLSFQKVLSKKLLEAQCLRKHPLGGNNPTDSSWNKTMKRSYLSKRSQAQDLVAKSSQHGLGSIQKLKVCFFMARRCWRSVVLWYSFGCLSTQHPHAAGAGLTGRVAC